MSRIRSGGRELSVRRLGTGDRITALHGGPGLDHHILLPLAEALGDEFEIWLPDLPGHGASPPENGARPGLRDTLAILESWLAGLPGGPGVLVGHSFGAWLVRQLLRRGRVNPRAAILLCPLAAPPARGEVPLAPRAPKPWNGGPSAREIVLAHVESEWEGPVGETVVRLLGSSRLRPLGEYAELTRVLRTEMAGTAPPFAPPCPVLVAGGERDRTTPRVHAEAALRSMDGARSLVLPGAGHYPFLENPGMVAAAVRDFLRRREPRRPYPSRRATT